MKIRYFVTALVITAIMVYKKLPPLPWYMQITPNNYAIMVDVWDNLYICKLPANWRQANSTCEEDIESLFDW